MPSWYMPIWCAAPELMSMHSLRETGPRSVTRTLTLLPVRMLVTLTTLPKGRVRWAAVMALWSKCPPSEVRFWECSAPYQRWAGSP